MNPRFLIPLLLLLSPVTIAQPPEFTRRFCDDDAGFYTAGSTYRRNLNTVLSTLAAGFYSLSVGQSPDRVTGIVLCRGDVGLGDCRACIVNATARIRKDCPFQKEAFGYYDFCQLRYSDRSISGDLDPDPVTYCLFNPYNASDPTQFSASLLSLLTRLRASAAGGSSVRKFATGMERQGNSTIYGLMQCSPDLSPELCDRCLSLATEQIPECCDGKVGGRIVNPDCNLMFENSRFFINAEEEPPPTASPPPPPIWEGGRSSGRGNSSRIIGVVVGVAVLCFVVVFFVFFCRRRRRLKKTRITNNGPSRHDDATAEELDSNQGWVQHNLEMFLRR